MSNRIFRVPGTAIAFFLTICLMAGLIEASVNLWTGQGPVKIDRYKLKKSPKSAAKQQAIEEKNYAYAVFNSVPGSNERRELENSIGLQFISVFDVQSPYVIYLISFHGQFESVQESLASQSPKFFNLEPIYAEDKVTPKIKNGDGFDSLEIGIDGKIIAEVVFHEDISSKDAESLIKKFEIEDIHHHGRKYLIKGSVEELRRISTIPEIRSIRETDTTRHTTNYLARELTGVNSIQKIDTSLIYPPDTSWMTNDSLTGDSVYIGIYDTGIDSLHLDFQERAGGDTILRRAPIDSLSWSNGFHGTHVAGIAAGNGWLSASTGAPRLHWRGVAPKSLLIGRFLEDAGDEGDVNNHSFVPGSSNGDYDAGEESIDDVLWRHKRGNPGNNGLPSHISVYAAANNGGFYGQYGVQRGYYSILAEPKNAIVVGSLNKEDTSRSPFSSMGPTRDGRIKPDIMAPGGSKEVYPGRTHRAPTSVEIDYIRILDSTGSLKSSWEFNSSTDGWGINRVLGGNWGGLEISDITSIIHKDSVIRFQCQSFGSYLWSDSIHPVVRMGNHDTLDIRYRIIAFDQSDYAYPYMGGRIYWKRLDSNAYSAGNIPIVYHFTDSNFVRMKVPLTGWTNEDTLMALRLDFAGDTASRGIYSTNSSSSGPQPYAIKAGTSMASPHVTGIIALMLQKYNERYLRPSGKNLHTDAFWNSTAKALLVQSAIDLSHPIVGPREPENPDILFHDPSHIPGVKYLSGPDFATGYGLVNAPGAISHVDTSLFKQDSCDNSNELIYSFNLQSNVKSLRVTLSWDDLPGNIRSPLESSKLINDLDLVLEDSAGQKYFPWVLNPLPQRLPFNDTTGTTVLPKDGLDPIDSADIQPAYHGINTRDNLEVVDVQSSGFLPKGKWKIHVRGTRVTMGPQDFSLVSDFILKRDSVLTQADSLHFQFDIGSPITTSTAYRPSDSTAYFGAGTAGDTLFAYSVSRRAIRWKITPHISAKMTDPVLAGNRLYIRAADSLYCIQDNGSNASLIWGRKLQPENDTTIVNVGDTSAYYYYLNNPSPAVDVANNRIYTSSGYSYNFSVKVGGTYPWDSTFAWGTVYKMWTFDLDGNLQDSISAFAPIDASPSAGSGGGFFADKTGRLYKIDTHGNYLGSTQHFPPNSTIERQPAIGPNNKIYVQGDSSIIGYNQITGDSLVAFNSQRRILTNAVVDHNDNLYLIAYNDNPIPATVLMAYSPSGLPSTIYTLAYGLHAAGNLSLGDDGKLYFIFDNQLYIMDTQTSPPFEGSQIMPVLAAPGASPGISNKMLIVPSGQRLYGYGVTSLGLADGWARTGKDNCNSGFQNVSPYLFQGVSIGNQSHLSTSTWNSDTTVYTLCGSSAGIGGTSDNMLFSLASKTGDFSLTTKVQSLDPTNPNAKSGLMISYDASSPSVPQTDAINGFVWIGSSNIGGFSKRLSKGGSTSVQSALGNYVSGKTWVTLRRKGGIVSAFISSNGLHFTKIGELAIGMGTVLVGPAYTSGNSSISGCSDFASPKFGTATMPALLVVGNTSLSTADSTAKARLVALGYTPDCQSKRNTF